MATSKHVKFEMRTVSRSQITEHVQNPRFISEENRKRLKANIKKVGLIEPIIWNQRTGNLVGGHQRLAVLDSLERGTDYELPVSVVDLSEEEEKIQMIALNNPSAQGEWDTDVLNELLAEVSWKDAGFSEEDLAMLDIEIMRDEAEANEDPEIIAARDQMIDLQNKSRAMKNGTSVEAEEEDEEEESDVELDEASSSPDWRAMRNEHKAKARDENSPATILTVYFTDEDSFEDFCLRYGVSPLEPYVRGDIFESLIRKNVGKV